MSTAGQGGGQESTAIAALSTFAHHGIIYIPLGYAKAFGQLTNLNEVHGGTWFPESSRFIYDPDFVLFNPL